MKRKEDSSKCRAIGCKLPPALEAYCKWNGETWYFCAKHRPPWASATEVTDQQCYRTTPITRAA